MSRSSKDKELEAKYQRRLENEFETTISYDPNGNVTDFNEMDETSSSDYQTFLQESRPQTFDAYERFCDQSDKLLHMKPSQPETQRLAQAIEEAHLGVTPSGVVSFAYFFAAMVIFLCGFLSYVILDSMYMLAFFVLLGVLSIGPLKKIPINAAMKWKMKASNQMILAVFYVVTYMRHTSNLEKAIGFAADQLGHPLGTDFKKIIWNVETQKFSSMKESLDYYLERWRGINDEFIEAMHLIESSLYEGYEDRRLELLDKSLDVILDGTFERMLHYSQELKSPITTLNMLGVILPILGLVILPLVVSFMDGIKWFHISSLYNILLPIAVYMFGKQILTTRPAGYGAIEIKKRAKTNKIDILGITITASPLFAALVIASFFIIIGLSPIIIHLFSPNFDISLTATNGLTDFSRYKVEYIRNDNASLLLLDYQPYKTEIQTKPDAELGPFGFGSSILSVFIPLGLGLGIGSYFRFRSGDVIKIREESKKLENEFSSALFQLGNRLGDGIPAEIAFARVSEVMKDTTAGRFFTLVSHNISNLGYGVKQAIFDERIGAINTYPSALVKSAMKVLSQSISKGPEIAAQAMGNVARYLKEIHRVDEKLKDLLSETINAMKGQVTFLSPAISGIVVGITAMITGILGKLSGQMESMSATAGGAGGLMEMFGQGIPTYHFQIIVGIYVVQLGYILTILSTGVENGEDPIGTEYELGRLMTKGIRLYGILTLIIMSLFNLIAMSILNTTTG
jgi:hypothetical protein